MANEIGTQALINARLSATTDMGNVELCPTKIQVTSNWDKSIVLDSIYTYTPNSIVRIEDIVKGKDAVVIADFDSLVLTYTWASTAGSDLDTVTVIINGDPSILNKEVGCGSGRGAIVKNTQDLICLNWAGDDTSLGGAESVLVYWGNIVNKDNYAIQPDIIDCELYAGWHTDLTSGQTGDIQIRVQAWKGGEVIQTGHVFTNPTGEIKVDAIKTLNCSVNAKCSDPITSKMKVGSLSYYKDNKNGVFVALT